ncbi:(1-3)-beta-glucanase [Paramecium bursaria Chlorella virus NE-JV-4]|nr:(1-3)-beta-glucanase [Paramecium bursaria Chlorella virus NE-JV-4]
MMDIFYINVTQLFKINNKMNCKYFVIAIFAVICIGGVVATAVVFSKKKSDNSNDTIFYDYDDFLENTKHDNHTNITPGPDTTTIVVVNATKVISNTTIDSQLIIGDINDTFFFINETTGNGIRVPIWWDEFNGDSIERSSWILMNSGIQHGWDNNEEQVYLRDNVDVYDGALHISALRNRGRNYTSGRIMSKGAWCPGMSLPNGKIVSKIYFESLIHVPISGQGIWPAFWAYPEKSVYGSFSQSGEIDMMELINDFDRLTQGIHYGGERPRNQKHMIRTGGSIDDNYTYEFGTYVIGAEWSLDTIIFYLNGIETGRVNSKKIDSEQGWYSESSIAKVSSPFDEPFNIIFNIAIGGNWPGPPDDNTPDEIVMSVDYFRVFADF